MSKKVTYSEIRRILSDHEYWNTSGGMFGTKANFSSCDLSNVDLATEDLAGVDFSHANLSRSNLSNATLMNCSFVGADLTGANLSKANLSNAHLISSDMSGALLDYAVFLQANLRDSVILGASLQGTDFRDSSLEQTKFTSRHAVKYLAFPLSDEQLFDVIFSDEENLAEQDTYAFKKGKDKAQKLVLYLHAPYISPIYLATFLLSLEGVFNNLYWLSNSKDINLNVLKDGMRPFYQGVPHQEWLKVQCIQEGSIKVTVTTLAATATILFTLSQFLEKIATLDLTRKLKEVEIEKVKAETEKVKQETRAIEYENNKNEISIAVPSDNSVMLSISNEEKVEITRYKQDIDYTSLANNLDSPNTTVCSNMEALLELATDPLLNVYYKYGQLGYTFRPYKESTK